MENIKELATAFAKFQGLVKSIPTNKTVNIKTKTGREIEFNYADLPQILATVRPTLAECGLSITQIFSGKMLVTYLMHASGESIKSEMTLHWPEEAKDVAAEITYFRRYSITSLLGLAAEDDMDAEEQETRDKRQAVSKATERKENRPVEEVITQKQFDLITSLGHGKGRVINEYMKAIGVKELKDLPKSACNGLIDELKNAVVGPSALAGV